MTRCTVKRHVNIHRLRSGLLHFSSPRDMCPRPRRIHETREDREATLVEVRLHATFRKKGSREPLQKFLIRLESAKYDANCYTFSITSVSDECCVKFSLILWYFLNLDKSSLLPIIYLYVCRNVPFFLYLFA